VDVIDQLKHGGPQTIAPRDIAQVITDNLVYLREEGGQYPPMAAMRAAALAGRRFPGVSGATFRHQLVDRLSDKL
jgi:hypothetical protein